MKTTNKNNRLSIREFKAKDNIKSLNKIAQKNILGGTAAEPDPEIDPLGLKWQGNTVH